MGNIVRSLSGLSQLLDDFVNSRKAVPKSVYRDVGQAIEQVEPESYFQKYTKSPIDQEGISRQYGLEFERGVPLSSIEQRFLGIEPDMSEKARERRYSIAIPDEDYERAVSINPLMPELMSTILKKAYPDYYDLVKSLPQHKLYNIDASELAVGSGVGSRIYPAIFDFMSGVKGETNVPTSLTDINELRRSMNMAAALKRNSVLSDKILAHPNQLNLSGLSPSEYMDLDRVEKIGALHTNAALKGLSNVEQLMPFRSNDPDIDRVLTSLENIDWRDAPNTFMPAMRPRANIFLGQGLSPSSLRNMGIVDAIYGGKPLRHDAFKGLAKKNGGLAALS